MDDNWTPIDDLFASLYMCDTLDDMTNQGLKISDDPKILQDYTRYCEGLWHLRSKELQEAERKLKLAITSRNEKIRYYSRILLDSIILHRAFKAEG